jgi:hypothetical protein
MESDAVRARALAILKEHEAKQMEASIKQELYEKRTAKLPHSL